MEYRLTNSNVGSIRAEDLYNYNVKHEANIFTKFLAWCEAQESNRFLWLALSFFAQIGMSLPATAYFIVFFGGNNLLLWIILATVNVPVLVLNLAALPTKTTLPVLFFGWLTQAAIIMYCIGFALMH
jgi:hypothetical protein